MNLIHANWPAPKNITAFTTTRLNGHSLGPYASLNLAHHVSDNPIAVEKNRSLLLSQYGVPSAPRWLTQTHSTTVVCADDVFSPIEADASYTQTPRLVCAILTADCLPILLCNKHGTQVAAVHAGWRGLAHGILKKTVSTFKNPNDVMSWLGPAISRKQYEIGEETFKQLATSTNKHCFEATQKNKYFCDLYAIARHQLKELGIHDIYGGEHCTFQENDLFFSYRKNATTGRIASLIWLDA